MADKDERGRFLPGHSLGGRQKSTRRIEGILQRIGQEEVLCEGGELKTRLEVLMRTVYKLAEDGTQWAVQFVAERTEGKVRESRVEDGQDERAPIKLLDIKEAVTTGEESTVDG